MNNNSINNNSCNNICHSSCNNNNYNNNNNNNEYSVKLYNSVFNNKYLKKIIFDYLNKFNILFVNIIFRSITEWKEFKYKGYLNRITFDFDEDYDLNQLPENIKHLTIRPPEKQLLSNDIPNHLDSISFVSNRNSTVSNSINISPVFSRFSTLNIQLDASNEPLINKIHFIPPSITDLKITIRSFLVIIDNPILKIKNILPNGIKKLYLERVRSFEDKCLPESLTDVTFNSSSPLIINQLPAGLNRLKFINLNTTIESNIRFPETLQELHLQTYKFNAKLPVYLKSLKLNFEDNYSLDEIQLPQSLEYLHIGTFFSCYKEVRLKSLPNSLKSLKLYCQKFPVLPDSLEELYIFKEFDQILHFNQLPSSLTYLNFGRSFNRVIDVNVLPAGLETLILGQKYSQVINPLAIPQNLKLLQIVNSDYLHPINLTPSTHPNTAISIYEDHHLYYKPSSSEYNKIRVLRLPETFESPLSTLQLQNKSNLEYLHLGYHFNLPIELSDLPTQNNIKTLVCSENFKKIINLEHFQNLETIIVSKYSNPTIITTTTTIIDEQQQQHVHYDNYKLKNIIVDPILNTQFLKQVDINFYKFIKYK